MKFKVRNGKHVDGTGKVYTKGQIVESDDDLKKLFPEKFTLVGSVQESETVETEEDPGLDADDDDEEKPKPKVKGKTNTWNKQK